ncbi:MAG: GNAT family N-acetyltransferase [Streptosporangiaceae bacterium]
MRVIRLVTPGDAAALAGLVQANREFLARWEPVRGPGYFTVDGQRAVIAAALSRYDQGEGLATAAVRQVITIAFGELGLHRIEAGTLPHNLRSRRVLERSGFTRFGLAPQYLSIAGRWQDHILYQRLSSAQA